MTEALVIKYSNLNDYDIKVSSCCHTRVNEKREEEEEEKNEFNLNVCIQSMIRLLFELSEMTIFQYS